MDPPHSPLSCSPLLSASALLLQVTLILSAVSGSHKFFVCVLRTSLSYPRFFFCPPRRSPSSASPSCCTALLPARQPLLVCPSVAFLLFAAFLFSLCGPCLWCRLALLLPCLFVCFGWALFPLALSPASLLLPSVLRAAFLLLAPLRPELGSSSLPHPDVSALHHSLEFSIVIVCTEAAN